MASPEFLFHFFLLSRASLLQQTLSTRHRRVMQLNMKEFLPITLFYVFMFCAHFC